MAFQTWSGYLERVLFVLFVGCVREFENFERFVDLTLVIGIYSSGSGDLRKQGHHEGRDILQHPAPVGDDLLSCGTV